MPVLLREADFGTWLSGEAGPEVLQPAAESALRERIVDSASTAQAKARRSDHHRAGGDRGVTRPT